MANQKKPTNAQLQKRISNAIVHVDRTKDTDEIYFDDKGLRLVVSEDFAVIETGFHRHVFNNVTNDGYSRPYLYTKRLVEIAKDTNAWVKDEFGNMGYSYVKLMEVLSKKEDKNDYNIATYFDWYLYNIFNPIYSIGEDSVQAFMVYMDYMHNLARNAILLDEHKDGLTNKQFIEEWLGKIREFTKEIDEYQVFVPKTDEQLIQENIEAMQANEDEKILQQQMANETAKDNGN